MRRLVVISSVLIVIYAAAAAVELHGQAPSEMWVRGGWLFDSVSDEVRRNSGIVIRAGKLIEVDADLSDRDSTDATIVELGDDDYIIPGMFDLHAHYAMDLFGRGRVDETRAYPAIFLANGVTSTFPAGEVDPEAMHELGLRVDRGEQPGPRIFNSGPYFGSARYDWKRDATRADIYREVDYWAAQGVRGFKAKGISPEHLRALIERAHVHGLPVTGHLDSGFRNSVNPRDAILMGIDRIEHFLGGDAISADAPAYASLVEFTPGTAEFDGIVQLYLKHRVFFDATLSAYGYFGRRDPEVYTQFTDEQKFLTPYMRQVVSERETREVSEQFERIYWVKRNTVKGFYDAGGGHLITLGTDHPSWGEFLSGFSIHRELHTLALSGIPAAAVIKIATINGARALNADSYLGTIEPGKFADLVVVAGNPLEDIRNTRNTRLVIKAGTAYDPRALLASVEGTIGPSGPDEISSWVKW